MAIGHRYRLAWSSIPRRGLSGVSVANAVEFLTFWLQDDGGKLVDAPCASGPPHTLRIELPDRVQLLVSAIPAIMYPTPYRQIVLDLRLLIPAATTVRLTGADVVLSSTAWTDSRSVIIVQIEDLDAAVVRFPPLAELPGTRRTPKYLGYQLSFADEDPRSATTIAAVDNFTVQLPIFAISGHTTSIPEISFEQKTLHGLRLACD